MSTRRRTSAAEILRRLADSVLLHELSRLARGVRVPAFKLPPGLEQYFRSARARQDLETDRQTQESRRRRGGRPRALTASEVAAHRETFARALAADPKLRTRKNAESFATKELGVKAGTAWHYIIKPVLERK